MLSPTGSAVSETNVAVCCDVRDEVAVGSQQLDDDCCCATVFCQYP